MNLLRKAKRAYKWRSYPGNKSLGCIKNVKLTIPGSLIPDNGSTDVAATDGSGSIIVQVGEEAKFFRLKNIR